MFSVVWRTERATNSYIPDAAAALGGWRFASGTVWFGQLNQTYAPSWIRRSRPDGPVSSHCCRRDNHGEAR